MDESGGGVHGVPTRSAGKIQVTGGPSGYSLVLAINRPAPPEYALRERKCMVASHNDYDQRIKDI